MHWLIVISLMLASSAPSAAPSTGAEPLTESGLAERVKTHINERMYQTCKDVVLKRVPGETFRGHADFLNGVQVDLEVTVADDAIQYRFLERPRSEPQSMQTRLEELETLIDQLDAEIDRLMQLCLRAGIDPTPAPPDEGPLSTVDGESVSARPAEEVPATVVEDQPALAEESPRFSWRLYEAIQKGMTYGQVMNILGDEGQAISGSFFDNAENEVVVWTNPDDSHLCIVFQNEQVLVKTQFGLPETAASLPR